MSSTDPNLQIVARSFSARPAVSGTRAAYWLLRVGAALCFVGHGAFGFITKASWLPYFGVVGIPEDWAWRLMPVVGAVDVTVGMAVLFAPRGLPLIYMTAWALWTALLRPLAGESVFETLERAGNYGVPFALLLLTGASRSWSGFTAPLRGPADSGRAAASAHHILRWTTVLLLFAHGALGAIVNSPLLSAHYAAIGLPGNATAFAGWFEIALALAVAARPVTGLLFFIAVWKILTESLFVVAGAPIWEFVERAGSYAAPLALVALARGRKGVG